MFAFALIASILAFLFGVVMVTIGIFQIYASKEEPSPKRRKSRNKKRFRP